jgi:TolA-binding protein
MKPAACPRAPEAEAMRDQRLSASQLASFERHLGACAACAHEVRALEALAGPLRDAGGDSDELHARRERIRLLSAFDQMQSAPLRRSRARAPRWQLMAAGLAVAVIGTALWHTQRPPAPNVVVRADSDAVWSQRHTGAQQQVTLRHGGLFVRVEHRSAQERPLLVVLPDGELEDIGTVFSVHVRDGRTTRVWVREGSVRLRIRGAEPVTVQAGETWIPRVSAPALACATPAGAASGPETRLAFTPRAGEPVASALNPPAAISARTGEPRRAVRPDPARDFRVAVALFDAGKNLDAASAFRRFVERYPRDPRAEDAAYMRMLSLQKSGALADMRQAARQYLQDYPSGLRRLEVERWLRP